MILAIFIISILLLTESVEPTQGWFIALTVLSALSLFGWFGRLLFFPFGRLFGRGFFRNWGSSYWERPGPPPPSFVWEWRWRRRGRDRRWDWDW